MPLSSVVQISRSLGGTHILTIRLMVVFVTVANFNNELTGNR